MKKYSVWTNTEGTSIAMALGEGRPTFGNGQPDPNATVLMFLIHAETWEEALAIKSLRLGWEPYRPHGAAKPCPSCGMLYYPESSGECWHCHSVS